MPQSIPTNLFDVLAESARRYGDREFLVIGRRDEVATFNQLAARAELFGRMLWQLGIRPGDRVGLWMTNRVDWAVAAYGAARIGAVIVSINTRLAPREVAHLLTLSEAKLWILEANFLGKIQATDRIDPVLNQMAAAGCPVPQVLVRPVEQETYPGTLGWGQQLERAKDVSELAPARELVARSGKGEFPELADVCVIISTSGTTAAPKGVMLGHRQLTALARACGRRQELTAQDRFYSIGPFFHTSGYMHAILTCLTTGTTLFDTQRFQVDEAMDVMIGEKVTAYHGFIGVLKESVAHPRFRREDYRSFTRAWYSAPAADMQLLEDAMGAKQCELYGLTETGGNVAMTRTTDPVGMRHDSDGQPHDGLEVAIIDPQTRQPLPEGTSGEIVVRGWNVMHGYFRDPEATHKAIDEGGWLHTGDQGVRLPGGFIKFLSRIKDVIRVGGENLSPMEVEEVVLQHPAVDQVAVVAAPHERLTEVPVAFVVLKQSVCANEGELTAYCKAQLANFKVPTRFIFVASLPRTDATNRIQKQKLRDMLKEMLEGGI